MVSQQQSLARLCTVYSVTTVFLCTTNRHVLELPIPSRVEWIFIFWSDRSWHLTKCQVWFYKSKFKILVCMRTPAHAGLSTCVSQFSFLKNPGGLNFNIFCENWHETSFYIFFSFKNYFFYPRKAGFWFLKKNPTKYCLTPKIAHFWVLKQQP